MMANDLQTRTPPRAQWQLRPLRRGPVASTAFATEWAMEQTAGTAGYPGGRAVFIVVGFDGSEPGQRALDAAAELLRDREGELEVVYVADPAPSSSPSGTSPPSDTSPPADELERRLAPQVRDRLETSQRLWHFQRRSGAVADELLAVADQLRRQHGSDATIVLVVGGPSHDRHEVVGSVALNLARDDRFPLVVVP